MIFSASCGTETTTLPLTSSTTECGFTFLGIVPRLPLQTIWSKKDHMLRKQKPTVVVVQEDSLTVSSMSTML